MLKMKSLSLSLLGLYCLFVAAGVYAQGLDASPNVETLRDIIVEQAADFSVVSIKIDTAASPGLPLSDICVSGKVNKAGKLKSLLIRFSADSSFVPSGEAGIIISGTTKRTLYSSSIHKVGEAERSSYTLTYLNDLDEVLADSAAVSQSTVFMDLFSKKNKIARLGIDLKFFKLLRAPSR